MKTKVSGIILFLCIMLSANFNAFAAGKTASDGKTKITAPKNKKTAGYFSKIDPDIVAGVENGSPSSIRNSMSQIRKIGGEYADNEKVLIFVASKIMQIVWPSERITWEVPEVPFSVSYTGALDFVNQGIFDSSTGNSDFLSTILPAFIILGNDISSENLELCRTAITKAQTFNENSVLAHYLHAVLLEKQGKFEEAVETIESVVDRAPESFEVRYRYALICEKAGLAERAENMAAQLLEEKPTNLDVLKINAKIAFALNNYAQAEEYVARVLQQMPNNLEFLLFRAVILIQKKDYIHAVSLLDMYARQNDSNIDYLILRAKVQLEWSKNTTLATQTIEKALSLYPSNKDALLLAARIASSTDAPVAGRYADELVEQVLADDAENEEALLYALNGLIHREQWQQAYEISSKLARKAEYSSEIIAKHAEVCLKLGKKNEALTIISDAYLKNPDDEVLLQSYIFTQTQAGNKKQSLELINSMIENSSTKIKSTLYFCRSLLQDSESLALSDLRSSLIANPRNGDALFRLYEIYYGKSDYRKAQYYLKQVVALNPNDSSVKKLNESLTKLVQKND